MQSAVQLPGARLKHGGSVDNGQLGSDHIHPPLAVLGMGVRVRESPWSGRMHSADHLLEAGKEGSVDDGQLGSDDAHPPLFELGMGCSAAGALPG